ncbi:alpha/beta-hydrolase [Lenzites betulinus]|nr:alpha/beta-hydrolase [Lenzites betulinus]
MAGFFPTLESFAKGTVATAAGISTVGVGLLFFGQNYLIYPSAFPPGSRIDVPVPTDYGLPYQDLVLVTADNVTLRCYMLTQRKEIKSHGNAIEAETTDDETDEEFASKRPTVIMFHGNGGNIGHRIPIAKIFYVKMRYNVLMLSYRGYGLSEGNPSEKGLRLDAQCALDHVLAHSYLSRTPIILYGQSIGGAVAIDLASRNHHAIRALIVENTFLSLPKLVPSALPVLGPFAFLCHQKWDSASKIPLLPAELPMLLLSGRNDQVVPREHMEELWQLVQKRVPGGQRADERTDVAKPDAKDESTDEAQPDAKDEGTNRTQLGNSRFHDLPFGTHNDTCAQHTYWRAVADFLEGCGLPRYHKT